MIARRDRLFDTYIGMDLLHNPFYILNATQRDSWHRIIELAEEKNLLSDTDSGITARTELTNPRKRIAAEVAWLSGVEPERIYDILLLLEASAENHLNCDKTTSKSIDSLAAALARVLTPKDPLLPMKF